MSDYINEKKSRAAASPPNRQLSGINIMQKP